MLTIIPKVLGFLFLTKGISAFLNIIKIRRAITNHEGLGQNSP
jgi:hypothetical protein